jgi:signal peptidase I
MDFNKMVRPPGGLAARAADPDRINSSRGPVPVRVKEEALRNWVASGESPAVKVSGCSMLPFLRNGDMVVVGPCRGSVTTGDIVVFFMQEVLLIHRVVRTKRTREGPVFRTKGDFALSLDPVHLREADLVGKAVAVRKGKATVDLGSAPIRAMRRPVAALSYWAGVILGRTR